MCLAPMFSHIIRKIKNNDFPSVIMIETISFCNSRCIICPTPELSKELPQGKMSRELYKKIIDEGSKYRVKIICFYLNNEPLLDENITERIRYAKEKIPYAKTVLSTNASLLTREITHLILNYVDVFSFSIFGIRKYDYEKMMLGLNFEKTIENIDYFLRYRKEKGFKNRVLIRYVIGNNYLLRQEAVRGLRKIYEFWDKKGIWCSWYLLVTRAGNVRSLQYNTRQNKRLRGCWYMNTPLTFMNILFNGDVVLCCMDSRREVILGNVKEKSLYEIWNSKLYNEVRDRIYLNKKSKDDFLCNRCVNPHFNI